MTSGERIVELIHEAFFSFLVNWKVTVDLYATDAVSYIQKCSGMFSLAWGKTLALPSRVIGLCCLATPKLPMKLYFQTSLFNFIFFAAT